MKNSTKQSAKIQSSNILSLYWQNNMKKKVHACTWKQALRLIIKTNNLKWKANKQLHIECHWIWCRKTKAINSISYPRFFFLFKFSFLYFRKLTHLFLWYFLVLFCLFLRSVSPVQRAHCIRIDSCIVFNRPKGTQSKFEKIRNYLFLSHGIQKYETRFWIEFTLHFICLFHKFFVDLAFILLCLNFS